MPRGVRAEPPIQVSFVGLTSEWCIYATRKILEFRALHKYDLDEGAVDQESVDQAYR
jgi:hypothetical protein